MIEVRERVASLFENGTTNHVELSPKSAGEHAKYYYISNLRGTGDCA